MTDFTSQRAEREISPTISLWPLVDSRAKQSQDDKPLTHQELVRTASVNFGLRSHPSLCSRRGMKVSATWPSLARVSFLPPIPARPFGLGFRCDEAPSDSGTPYRGLSRQKNQAKNAKATPRYHDPNLIASGTDKGYLSVCRSSDPFGLTAVAATKSSPGALQARTGAFARSELMPSNCYC